jgi:hypothetical protein
MGSYSSSLSSFLGRPLPKNKIAQASAPTSSIHRPIVRSTLMDATSTSSSATTITATSERPASPVIDCGSDHIFRRVSFDLYNDINLHHHRIVHKERRQPNAILETTSHQGDHHCHLFVINQALIPSLDGFNDQHQNGKVAVHWRC